LLKAFHSVAVVVVVVVAAAAAVVVAAVVVAVAPAERLKTIHVSTLTSRQRLKVVCNV